MTHHDPCQDPWAATPECRGRGSLRAASRTQHQVWLVRQGLAHAALMMGLPVILTQA